jgi:hypothetical protein
MRRRNRIALLIVGALAATAIATLGTYSVRGSDPVSRADEPPRGPDKSATPLPGTTPDTTQPFWHYPFINQDRLRPHFAGQLNGYTIDPGWKGRSPFDLCPGTGLHPPEPARVLETVVGNGPMQIDPRRLPAGVTPESPPDSFLCGNELMQVVWSFDVKAGTPDVNEGGSGLDIWRIRGLDPIQWGAPIERWKAITIAGRPAVLSGPIVTVGTKQFGSCFLGIYDREADVLTGIVGTSANEPFCIKVGEALFR